MKKKKSRTLKMHIDGKRVSVPAGITVQRAAELNGIYIPSLCSHKDLAPFGGCRMCMVEIEGMRGYPLACNTAAADGMDVKTETPKLRDLRREVLQLILSEHPSSCLICDERFDCGTSMYTIRKAGVTTGCRYCPNDKQCELQDLVEYLGVTDLEYPCLYRGFEAEQDDPFFDRDYNICILCGRCIRMCSEVRGASVLAFTFRGPNAKVGPAFGQSHVDAGCEFCGACVSVCPTGTLAEKGSKWDGKPDGMEVSTCPFCPVGCQVELYHKDGKLVRVRANLDSKINDGQLCVRGAFCLPETTHHYEREKKPHLAKDGYFREVPWDEAVSAVASKLAATKPEEFLMLASGDLTNESLFAAQKFTRECLKSGGIDTTARLELPGGPGLWAKLFSAPISIKGLRKAGTIVAVNLDSRFYFSVAGVEIRHALKDGAKLVTIDPRDSNLAHFADRSLAPAPGTEGALLAALAGGKNLAVAARKCGVDKDELAAAAELLSAGGGTVVVVGPQAFAYSSNAALVDALAALAKRKDTDVLPLFHGANTRGAFELGAFNGFLPGIARAKKRGCGLDSLSGAKSKRPKVVYLVGETPLSERPDCDYVIAQDIYRPPFEVDAFLPAASFAEAEGTLTNVEGRVQRLAVAERVMDGAVTGFVKPDWAIFSALAAELGEKKLKYKNAAAVTRDIAKSVRAFPAGKGRKPRTIDAATKPRVERKAGRIAGKGDYLLVAEPAGFRHRGIDLSSKVAGLIVLGLEEGFRMNPADLKKLRVKTGGAITVTAGKVSATAPARADEDCPRGVIYFSRPTAPGGSAAAKGTEPLYALKSNPTKVTAKAAK